MYDDMTDPMFEDLALRRRFRDPGGRSALHPGKRCYPCPTCRKPNKLTAADKRSGYQCNECADRVEGTYFGGDY